MLSKPVGLSNFSLPVFLECEFMRSNTEVV